MNDKKILLDLVNSWVGELIKNHDKVYKRLHNNDYSYGIDAISYPPNYTINI